MSGAGTKPDAGTDTAAKPRRATGVPPPRADHALAPPANVAAWSKVDFAAMFSGSLPKTAPAFSSTLARSSSAGSPVKAPRAAVSRKRTAVAMLKPAAAPTAAVAAVPAAAAATATATVAAAAAPSTVVCGAGQGVTAATATSTPASDDTDVDATDAPKEAASSVDGDGDGDDAKSLNEPSAAKVRKVGSPGRDATRAPIEELTEARLEKRQRQIDIGKSTAGYIAYTQQVPKHKRQLRREEHPVTPSKSQHCSKRQWDGKVRKWRRLLHLW